MPKKVPTSVLDKALKAIGRGTPPPSAEEILTGKVSFRAPPEAVLAFQARMNLSDRKVAELLEISRTTWTKYKAEGAPKVVALAMAAVIRGLAPWPD